MTIKEIRTKGAKWFRPDNGPATINSDIKGVGTIRWTDNLTELSQMLEGLEDPSVAITSRDFWEWPIEGLRYQLGNELDKILNEAQLGKGAIAINEPLKLRAAWLDDEYWPNTERGH